MSAEAILVGLTPGFRDLARALLADCQAAGLRMAPCCGLRTPLTQARLWRQSRPTAAIHARIAQLRAAGATLTAALLEQAGPSTGPWATNALPGESWHNWGEALDCYALGRDGKPDWRGDHPAYKAYAAAARKRGLTSLIGMGDAGHIQLRRTEPPAQFGGPAALDQALRTRWPNLVPLPFQGKGEAPARRSATG